MGVPVRSWTHWVLWYAPPRAVLSLLRRGDPLAKLLTTDPHPVDDIYPLIEQIRQRGRMSRYQTARLGHTIGLHGLRYLSVSLGATR